MILISRLFRLFKSAATNPATEQLRQSRIAWWRDAKYGLFIHWGAYAVPSYSGLISGAATSLIKTLTP